MALSTSTLAAQDSQADILERYERANSVFFDRKDLTFKTSVNPNWVNDTNLFWYVNTVKDTKEYILVDAGNGTRLAAFDHEKLATALSAKSKTNYTASALPLEELSFAADENAIKFKLKKHWYTCTLDTYEISKTNAPPRDANREDGIQERRRGRRNRGERPPRKNITPDKQWQAIITNFNLYVKSTATNEMIQLTKDGTFSNAYSNPVFSPDSKKIIALHAERGDHKKMHMVESCPKEGVRPVLKSHEYALPGDKLDTFDLWIFDIDTRSAVKVDADRLDWDWTPPIRWEKDSSCVFYRQMYRGYQRYTVRKVDPETGLSEIIIDEKTDTSIQPSYEYLYYVENTNEMIWASERDGWHHLYLFDRTNGKLKNQITRGDWFVRQVLKVDDDKRQIVFTANGREAGEDPYLIHYYRVNFDGSGLVNLTPGNGSHDAKFSPDWQYIVDNYSRVDFAPVTVLRSAEDGSLICELETADIEPLLATGWKWPEAFCAKGRDGTTDIYGVIFRPMKLDESKKYPVIEMIYTGPHSSHVPKSFRNFYWIQAICELGFIVVQVDGMGTGNRSKAFHDVSYKNLGDGGLPDHIAWLRAAEEKYPYIDSSNVGVSGGSAGGYDATHALITHPEVYKAAISSSGNHDHRTDKVWWTELWMGYPVTDVYKEQSNVENADKIEGALFLIHGEMDNNVNCAAATMQLANALIKANKDFELLIVPGGGHCPGGDYITRRQWNFFVKNLQGVVPPKGFVVGDRQKEKVE